MLQSRPSNIARSRWTRTSYTPRLSLRHASAGSSSLPTSFASPLAASTASASKTKEENPSIEKTWPTSSVFASYDVGIQPTTAQLGYANRYFEKTRPIFLSSHAKFRTLPVSLVPEVAFLGRSNVGKSSLLNALLHRTAKKIAHVSKKPGRTKLMNAFGVGGVKAVPGEHESWEGKGGLVVMDMPGYGKASQEDWGTEIVKYLASRRQLRRTFVLIDSVHGVKETDLQLLQVLWHNKIPYQVVMSKIDKVVMPRSRTTVNSLVRRLASLPAVFAEGRSRASQSGLATDIITCSAEVDMPPGSGRKIGIDNLRWAILCAAGLESDETGNSRSSQRDLRLLESTE